MYDDVDKVYDIQSNSSGEESSESDYDINNIYDKINDNNEDSSNNEINIKEIIN